MTDGKHTGMTGTEGYTEYLPGFLYLLEKYKLISN